MIAEFDSRTLGIVDDNDVLGKSAVSPRIEKRGLSSVVESRSNICYPGRYSHFGSK